MKDLLDKCCKYVCRRSQTILEAHKMGVPKTKDRLKQVTSSVP